MYAHARAWWRGVRICPCARQLPEALDAGQEALDMYPCYTDMLREMAVLHLDSADPDQALHLLNVRWRREIPRVHTPSTSAVRHM